jgi:hypothetical protein
MMGRVGWAIRAFTPVFAGYVAHCSVLTRGQNHARAVPTRPRTADDFAHPTPAAPGSRRSLR